MTGENATIAADVPSAADAPRAPGVPFYDTLFRQKRKGDKWKVVDAPDPALEGPVADTHCHLHMTPDPAFALARCACNGVPFVGVVTDPPEDGTVVFDQLEAWKRRAAEHLAALGSTAAVPACRITVGCHPHNAKLFDTAAERQLEALLEDPRVSALGEIGLDYHYDFSPREQQRAVFRRQIQMAKQAGLPVSLHIREAHDEALAILEDEGWPQAGTLLHCCTLGPHDILPWIQAGCYIAFGGALTFNNGEAVREAAALVPQIRLLTETDTPYMAPVPLRGSKCLPDFVVFTAQRLAEVRCCEPGPARAALLEACIDNARRLLDAPR
ncbi:MAG: TatD family hydrolase [Coriobacteriia bacterium]|nr:TatD family hydrolase [Coriobacteriia bacterium]